MRMPDMARRGRILGALIALGAAAACGAPTGAESTANAVQPAPDPLAPVTEGASLTLEAVDASDAGESWLDVAVRFQGKPGREGPRTAELWLSHDASLALESATPGEAAEIGRKQVIAQAPEAGEVRLVFFASDNLERMGYGVLATVRFRRLGPGPARIAFIERRPAFAPADTELGVSLGPALTVAGRP